jgi:hypothetical protein
MKSNQPYYELPNVQVFESCDHEFLEDIAYPVNNQSNEIYWNNFHFFESIMVTALETNLEQLQKRSFTFEVEN